MKKALQFILLPITLPIMALACLCLWVNDLIDA